MYDINLHMYAVCNRELAASLHTNALYGNMHEYTP